MMKKYYCIKRHSNRTIDIIRTKDIGLWKALGYKVFENEDDANCYISKMMKLNKSLLNKDE